MNAKEDDFGFWGDTNSKIRANLLAIRTYQLRPEFSLTRTEA